MNIININSLNPELLARVCSNIVPINPTKDQSLKAFQDYKSLRCISKNLNFTMNLDFSIQMFIQAIWVKTFGPNSGLKYVPHWEEFLEHGITVLKNWIDDAPHHYMKDISGGKFQSVRKKDGVELMNYDFATKSLSRVQIELDSSTSKQKLELDGEVIAPGKMCYPFIAQTDDLLAINQGDSNVKIFIKHNGQILTSLENLGIVKQIEMFGDFLFILQQGEEGSCLLRYDTREIHSAERNLKSPDKLTLCSDEDVKNNRTNKRVSRFFLSENRINILTVIGVNLHLRSLFLSPMGKFPCETDLGWVTVGTFPNSAYIAPEGENFIICQLKDFNLKRLKISENCTTIEEIVETIPLSCPATEIVELHCNSGKVFIFYYNKKNNHHNVVTFDLETKHCSNSTDLPYESTLKPYYPSFAWHTTVEKTNFMYFRLLPAENQDDEGKLAITIIDYG